MSTSLDERYFTWLYGQVASVDNGNPSRNYWKLLKQLYIKEFIWIIPNDDNRAEDGRDLRRDFVDEKRIVNISSDWMSLGCSMLEMFIGLSRRLAFEDGGDSPGWFWKLIENLGLDLYNDNVQLPEKKVDEILDQIIWRTYRRNGHGGLFPLRRAVEDQRDVELWYQLNTYLLEKGY